MHACSAHVCVCACVHACVRVCVRICVGLACLAFCDLIFKLLVVIVIVVFCSRCLKVDALNILILYNALSSIFMSEVHNLEIPFVLSASMFVDSAQALRALFHFRLHENLSRKCDFHF